MHRSCAVHETELDVGLKRRWCLHAARFVGRAACARESACITLPVLQKHLRVSGLRGGEDFGYLEIIDRIRDTPPPGVLYCTITLSAHA